MISLTGHATARKKVQKATFNITVDDLTFNDLEVSEVHVQWGGAPARRLYVENPMQEIKMFDHLKVDKTITFTNDNETFTMKIRSAWLYPESGKGKKCQTESS